MVRSGTPSVTMLPATTYGEKWDSLRHDVAGHNSGIHLPRRRHRSTVSRFDGWEPNEPPRGVPWQNTRRPPRCLIELDNDTANSGLSGPQCEISTTLPVIIPVYASRVAVQSTAPRSRYLTHNSVLYRRVLKVYRILK